ncbi:hypothetical protein ACQRWP_17000 [Micromonospora trifolii]|uniref:hypothetical protein n=1 Tax=Micromonospora trifolii TaxID=2911208 RepID=UPI003D2EE3C8
MALTVKMMSSGDVMLTYLHLTTAVAALRVSVKARTASTPQERRMSLRPIRLLLCCAHFPGNTSSQAVRPVISALELQSPRPSVKTPAAAFAGDVYLTPICNGTGPSRMTAALVRLTPGAPTNWHSHAVGQTLHIGEGSGLVGSGSTS